MKAIKNNSALIAVLAIALVPILIWIFMQPLATRFSSSGVTFRSLGQITGLLGMSMLSLNFVLSSRLKFLDKIFSGLNRVYVNHHQVGAIAFSLLLFHPVFLTARYLTSSFASAFDFLFGFNDWPTLLGEIGLGLFIALMAVTFYLNWKYQNWKYSHKLLGIVLVLGSIHMILVPSDIAANGGLKIYMLTLAGLGLAAHLYRTVFRFYKKEEYIYELKEIKNVNENIFELALDPVAAKMHYLAGQFVFIRFEVPGILSESHPFSISSSPDGSGRFTLGIKALGDYTSEIPKLKPGTRCKVEGPFGIFSYQKASSKRQIWAAGGIGITPFLGMTRDLADLPAQTGLPAQAGLSAKAEDYKVDLYYSVKNESEAAFGDELRRLASANPNFKFHEHFSQSQGYLSADLIKRSSGDLNDAEIFLCGPVPFMRSLRSQFVALGINNAKIHSEEFSL